MKNREYKCADRAVKEVKSGVWRCRYILGKHALMIEPITVHDKVTAMKWLDGKVRLHFPDSGRSTEEERLIRRQRKGSALTPMEETIVKKRLKREETIFARPDLVTHLQKGNDHCVRETK